MAITVVSSGSATGMSAAPTVTLSGTILADDYILAFMKADNAALDPSLIVYTSGSGLALLCAGIEGEQISSGVAGVRAAGSESGDLVFGINQTWGWVCGFIVLRGVDATTAFDVAVSHASHHTTAFGDTTPTSAALTTVTDGAMVIELLGYQDTTNTITAVSSDDTGETEWVNEVDINGDLAVLATHHIISTAGLAAGSTFTLTGTSGSHGAAMWVGALRPAAGGGGGSSIVVLRRRRLAA